MLPRTILAGMGCLLVLVGAGCADRGQPSGPATLRPSASVTFHCPVTIPNGQAPPGETESPSDFGNGQLWTLLPVDGKLVVTTTRPPPPGTTFGDLNPDGFIATKFPWWGGQSAGQRLRITGNRLDREAKPLQATIAPGFTHAPHFWATTIALPGEGCWKVTGTAGTERLRFIVQVKADRGGNRSSPPALRPPAPHVITLGATRIATLVSYCWNESRRGVCADGAPGHAGQTLRWTVDASVRVDLRLAAHDVHFETARIVRSGAERDVVHLRARPLDRAGRGWILCLPHNAQRANDLLIFARFAQGDMLADLRLRPAQASGTHTHRPGGHSCP